MRLKRSRKIAVCGVCAAIASVCVILSRFSPVGSLILFAIAGTTTLLAARMCGLGYGFLTYCATGLISLAVMPYNLVYVLVLGLGALLREVLFGAKPRPKWRYAVGYAVLAAFYYGTPLAVFFIIGDALGLAKMIEMFGGIYAFCGIAAIALLAYDFAVSYLADGLNRAVTKGGRKPKPPADAFGTDTGAEPPTAVNGGAGAEPSDGDGQVGTDGEENGSDTEPPDD